MKKALYVFFLGLILTCLYSCGFSEEIEPMSKIESSDDSIGGGGGGDDQKETPD